MKIGTTLALVSLAALGGALFFTNPNEDDYAAYLSSQVTVEARTALCAPEEFSDWLGKVGEALSSACQGVLSGGGRLSEDEVQGLIKENTDYKNRFLFSTYDTETPFGNYRAIGVFDRFILSGTPGEAAESE
ncbi:MAG: DUF4359 domain-containing protein [Cyanobacteria bacterium J06621_3]